MWNRLFILFTCSLFFVSCASKEINLQGAESEFYKISSHAWYKGYFYVGSDENFHYFIEKWDYSIDDRFKISKSSLKINDEFIIGEKEIRLTPFEDQAKEILFKFGGVKYHKPLYPLFTIDGVNYYGIEEK